MGVVLMNKELIEETGKFKEKIRKSLRYFYFVFLLVLLVNYAYYLIFLKPYIAGLHDDKIGISFLGGFVGWVLGLGLQNSGTSLKTILTVLGAALSGAPVIFLHDVDDRWFYPIGLVAGLSWIRIKNARKDIIEHSGNTRRHQLIRFFGYLDLAVIATFSILAILYAILIEG
jgi:hypothetical protein